LIGLHDIRLKGKRKKVKQNGKDCGNSSVCIIKNTIMANTVMSKSSINTCWYCKHLNKTGRIPHCYCTHGNLELARNRQGEDTNL